MKLFRKILAVAVALVVLAPVAATADDIYDIRILKGSTINLVSQVSRVPILIENNYDTEVRVLVNVSTSNLKVRLPKTTSVTIGANSTMNAVVPVQAVANGDVQLTVWLTSFSGVRLGESQVIDMHVIGEAEAIAIGSLSVLVFGLLVVGSIRMIRRRKLNA